MPEWPMYVYVAADTMGYRYDEPGGSMPIEQFAARWEGFGADALKRAIQMAIGDEWLFAMLLLIYAGIPDATDEVLPYLDSSEPLKRWYSALYLGEFGDKRALAALSAMLTEYLPAPEDYQAARREHWRFEDTREGIAYTLGKIGVPSCIPALRQGLQTVLHIEKAQVSPPDDTSRQDRWRYESAMDALRRYQNAIVYALGRLGALGALVGLQEIEDRIDLWRVHLLMGSLHEHQYPVRHLARFKDEPALFEKLTSLLAHIFGLTSAEQAQHLAHYEAAMLPALSSLYSAEELAHARRAPLDPSAGQ